MDKIPTQVIDSIKKFRSIIEKKFEVRKIILFGSYAKGLYSEFSDIDLCIIADGISNSYAAMISIAPDVIKTDFRIEPVIYNVAEFNETDFGLIGEIKRNGIEIIN